jgi:hypothetical protein
METDIAEFKVKRFLSQRTADCTNPKVRKLTSI